MILEAAIKLSTLAPFFLKICFTYSKISLPILNSLLDFKYGFLQSLD